MAVKKDPGKPLDDRLDPRMALHSGKYWLIGIIIGIILFMLLF